jgi:two-component system, OmpR family, alkaline phosphatase synthesis response regulator PhoP
LTKKILIVDDEQEFRTFMTLCLRRLRQHDVEFYTAENGEYALKMVEAEQPDLIFLDLMMPGIDGFEVCRQVKSNEKTKHIHVIILTARSHPDDKLKGTNSGANEYLVKPFPPNKIIERAQQVLGLSTAPTD